MKRGYLSAVIIAMITFQIETLAAIPSEYAAISIKAPASFSERVFDLTPVIEKSRRENKNIFLYLGAADCPPCKEYEMFLSRNFEMLKESFSNYVIGDIQTWIRGPDIYFLIDGQKIPIPQFKEKVGDANKRILYPTYWILDHNLRQIRQLPAGNKQFLDIERHKALIGK